MILQSIADIAEICSRKNLTDVVIAPGSRSAPLTLAFARHPSIHTKVISDERSAGYIALGMALSGKKSVAVVCTSGTAALNLYPAIAEAFYQKIPLVIFTADRPAEWINQNDGQAIRQDNVFALHSKESFQLPASYENEDAQKQIIRIISEAINISRAFPAGPVHVNVPLREPFYPAKGETFSYSGDLKIIEAISSQQFLGEQVWFGLNEEWDGSENKLIVAGQNTMDQNLINSINNFSTNHQIPVVTDIISNGHALENSIKKQDAFLVGKEKLFYESLQPDLLITYGNSVISKNLKTFLRKYSPNAHWHLQPAGPVADTFQSLTKIIPVNPDYFFSKGNKVFENNPKKKSSIYLNCWKEKETNTGKAFVDFFSSNKNEFGEFEAIKLVLETLPSPCDLHLANSMSVRYANFISLNHQQNQVEVYSNRGTSGIDGCTSTATGSAIESGKLTVLLTGDMAFFYDRNALWHSYVPNNLRIIILNNHAGEIFRLIDGPAGLPELEEYFETNQNLNAENTAKDFGLEYYFCNDRNTLNEKLQSFFNSSITARILEIETSKHINSTIFSNFKKYIKQYGT